jgi:hypothetical protein
MEYCKHVRTPIVTGCKLIKEDESKEENQNLYISMIGNLLYLKYSRPYIMQAVGLVGRFLATPKEIHVQSVKIIFRYFKGTLEFGLWYPIGTNFTPKFYIDVDWEGSVDDGKSTNGGTFILGNSLVPWLRKNKSSISLYTTKTQYIAAEA